MEQEKSELITLSTKAKQNALKSLYPSEPGSQTEIFSNTDCLTVCVFRFDLVDKTFIAA